MPEPRFAPLEPVLAALELTPLEIQSFDPSRPRIDPQRPLIVLPPAFESARPLLRARYGERVEARAVVDGRAVAALVSALPGHAQAWALPALPPELDRRSLEGLRGVMERLFGPSGCPWDRAQTHESLRRYFLEECYELVDAIDRGDPQALEEELGDVLAHLFMQTALAQEAGAFTLEDVLEHASAKFVRRHPHVFGDEEAGTEEALLERWEQIKAAERAARGEPAAPVGALDSVPLAAPALQRAQAMQHRARRAGPAAPPAPPALRGAAEAFAAAPTAEGLGALLWEVVGLADDAGIDAEEALRLAANRFSAASALGATRGAPPGREPGAR